MSLRIRGMLVLALLVATATPAAAAQPPASSWPQLGNGPAHLNTEPLETAFTPGNVADLAVAWTAAYGRNAAGGGGPAVVDGVAYITGSDGYLSAFSLEACAAGPCRPLWRGRANNGIYSTPAVAGGLVLVGSADHFLYAFRVGGCGEATCLPAWKGQLSGAALSSSVAVSDGVAYLGDYGGRLYAFSVDGCGRSVCPPAWTGRAGPHEQFNTAPAVAGGHVYIAASFVTANDFSARLLSFWAGGCGRPQCAPEWKADLLGQVDGAMAPLVSGDTVYIGSGTRFGVVPNGKRHLFAFAAGGCGLAVCPPLWSYDVGVQGVTGGIALSGGVLYASSQTSPDPNTDGVLSAFPALGCGEPVCPALWIGVNFAAGAESPPVVVNGVVFVAKGPASGFPVDAAVLSYAADGCGQPLCQSLSFTQLGPQQFYLGSPIAVADGTLFVASQITGGTTNVYALQIPDAAVRPPRAAG